MSILLSLHILAVIIWVGGMFFAYMVLRPIAVSTLEPPLRLRLWREVFSLFFKWVWVAIVTLWLSGLGMIFMLGGMALAGPHIHLMLSLGIVMTLIFLQVYFRLFPHLQALVTTEQWQLAGDYLFKIRDWIRINLAIGLLVACIAVVGRFL